MFGPLEASLGYSNQSKKAGFYVNLGFYFWPNLNQFTTEDTEDTEKLSTWHKKNKILCILWWILSFLCENSRLSTFQSTIVWCTSPCGKHTVARCCTLSFSERNVPFPREQPCFTCTCFTVPHVHVVLYHMHMSYCFTCTSKTILHTEASYVTLRDRTLSAPKK